MDRKRKRLIDDSDDSSGDEASKRKQLASDNDSSDSEDANDGTWTENGDEKVPKKKKKKKEKVVSDSDSNDSDSSALEFDDGFDSDLMGDEDDRNKLEEMTEAQREKILYERTERREAMKKRWEIEKKIRTRTKLEKKKKREQKSETESSDDEGRNGVLLDDRTDRRKTLDKKKNSDVLEQLKAEKKRKEDLKRKKDDEKKTLDVKDVFSSDDDSDDEKKMKKYIGDSDSNDSDSDDERRRETSDDEDVRSKRDEDPLVAKRREKVTSREDLKPAKVSRFRMAQWLHMPWFGNTIRGCYVRVNIGNGEVKSCYRIAEIVDVVESQKVYPLDPGDGGARSQTNKAVRLKIADRSRDYRLCYISNSDWTDSEFEYWKKQMDTVSQGLPTFGHVMDREKKINVAKQHVITDAEIEQMVKEKAKHRSAPVNFATKKTTLIKLRDAAETEGNIDQVASIQIQLEKLEERANMLNRERQKDISGITYINDRIKAALRKKDLICEREWKEFREKKVDPFTRRTTAPIMVSNTNSETKSMIKDILNERYTEDIDMRYEELTFVKEKDEGKETVMKKVKVETHDLYSAHDFDIDIDIDILPGSKTPQSNPNGASSNSNYSNNSAVSMSDYKSRHNM